MKTPNELLMLLIQLDSHVKRIHPVHRFVYVQTAPVIQLGHMGAEFYYKEICTFNKTISSEAKEMKFREKAKRLAEKPIYG
jgi:hypothetical protein